MKRCHRNVKINSDVTPYDPIGPAVYFLCLFNCLNCLLGTERLANAFHALKNFYFTSVVNTLVVLKQVFEVVTSFRC